MPSSTTPTIEVIAIGGTPATGKSMLLRGLLLELAQCSQVVPQKAGLVYAEEWGSARVVTLGKYGHDETFPGTDRLSMACQPDVVKLLDIYNSSSMYKGYKIVFEGDRLMNLKFFRALTQRMIPFQIILISARADALAQRRSQRPTTQAPAFIKGRETKLNTIAEEYSVTYRDNSNPARFAENLAYLLTLCGIKPAIAPSVIVQMLHTP